MSEHFDLPPGESIIRHFESHPDYEATATEALLAALVDELSDFVVELKHIDRAISRVASNLN